MELRDRWSVRNARAKISIVPLMTEDTPAGGMAHGVVEAGDHDGRDEKIQYGVRWILRLSEMRV